MTVVRFALCSAFSKTAVLEPRVPGSDHFYLALYRSQLVASSDRPWTKPPQVDQTSFAFSLVLLIASTIVCLFRVVDA
jgi:hypothetical protein